MKRVFTFLLLVALCIAAWSHNLSQSTNRQYAEYERLAQAGDLEAAEFGYHRLAMKYPFTPAGISAARQIVKGGESPVWLVLDIMKGGVRNTTAAEWFVLISAFFVITVAMGSNVLPSSVLILFVLSGAGMFHLSYPLVSIDNIAFEAFLAANPYIYLALTLLIVGGYLHRRWEATGQMAYNRAFVRGKLALGDQLLVKEIYSEKLKALQERVEALVVELQTPYGRHLVKEVKRVNETVQKELQIKRREMDDNEVRYQNEIQATEQDFDRAQQELLENKIRFKSKAIGRREYKHIRLEKESYLKQGRQRIAKIKASLNSLRKNSFGTRLQFTRRDLFLSYLHGEFVDRKDGTEGLTLRDTAFHPKIAEANIKKKKIIYRKSSNVSGRLVKLERRRARMKGNVYKDRLKALTNEKKIIDKALIEVVEKIFEQLENCKNEIERMESTAQAMTAELADMKTLQKVRNCFPTHVKARIQKIRQGLRFCKNILPVLRKIEKIYSETPA